MGDYHSSLSSPHKNMMTQEAATNLLPPPTKNPLAVASLTSPSPLLPSSKPIESAPSRSQPFSCPSLDETLQNHGASAPAQTPKFRLQMRQEPLRGLAVGNDDSAFKNARVTPLDPPPICELVPERSSDVRFISVPELSVQACLVYNESPYTAVANSSKDKDPMMSGLQECGFIAPITGRHEECLFVFSELGIRTAGEYRIRFDLIDRLGSQFRRLTSIYTQPFTVVADKKNFPGLSTSTELIHSLVRRGLKLRIIKSQSGKPRKRKKLGRENMEEASVSGQSVTPSPSHYHRQPQQHAQPDDQERGYRQQQPPLSPSKWQAHSYRQHPHPSIISQQATQPSNRNIPPESAQRPEITPSLSPSAGSKTSTDSVPSIASTPDEEHQYRRLPAPQHAYLTPRSQPPHPNYSDSREGREDDANRPFRTLAASSSLQHETSHHHPSAGFSRLDHSRPTADTSSRNRPILPPLSSLSNSPSPRLPSTNR